MLDLTIFEVTPSAYLETTDAVKELKKNLAIAVEEAKEITILTNESVEKAGYYIKKFSQVFKTAKTIQKGWTEPIKQTAKDIEGFFSKTLYEAEIENARLEKELTEYATKQRKIQRQKQLEEQIKAEEEKIKIAIEKEQQRNKLAEEKGVDISTLPQIEIPIVPEVVIEEKKVKTFAGVSQRNVAKWELIDFALVPDKYKMLNESLIGAERRSAGVESEVSTIPGIKFTVELTLQKR